MYSCNTCTYGTGPEGTDIPYVSHPFRVARIPAEETNYPVSTALITAAILHDVVEDTEIRIDQFPEDVHNLVFLLSYPDHEDTHDKVKAIHRIAGHPDALMIKMADRYANLTEENEFLEKYRSKPDVQESTTLLLAVAKEAGLDETDLYQKLNGVMSKD